MFAAVLRKPQNFFSESWCANFWKIHGWNPKMDGGLVQMISLFKQVIFKFPSVNFSECKFAAGSWSDSLNLVLDGVWEQRLLMQTSFVSPPVAQFFVKRKASPNIWLRKTFGSTMVPSL